MITEENADALIAGEGWYTAENVSYLPYSLSSYRQEALTASTLSVAVFHAGRMC